MMFDFWAVIGVSTVEDGDEVEKALSRIEQRLSTFSESELARFDEELREHLFRIDKRVLAEMPVTMASGQVLPQTDDHFLYARCACILGGESDYSAVLAENRGFDRFVVPHAQRAEELLYLALDAYEALTGSELAPSTNFPTDSGSNKHEWD